MALSSTNRSIRQMLREKVVLCFCEENQVAYTWPVLAIWDKETGALPFSDLKGLLKSKGKAYSSLDPST
uniref:Putative ovule protein n=1 Tax=Solanum chacoense TaxID=4108 RepID=A0A0V0HTF3_SOLCH